MSFSNAYDNPNQQVHLPVGAATTAAGAAAVGGRFVAFTDMNAKAIQVTVVTAGTSATTGNALIVKKTSNATVTTLATVTLGSSTAGVTTNVSLSDTALAAGDYLSVTNGTDATGVAALVYEVAFVPSSNFTL